MPKCYERRVMLMVPLKKCRRCVFRLDMGGLGQKTACGYLYYTGAMRPPGDECLVYLSLGKNRKLRKKLCDRAKREGLKPLGRIGPLEAYIAERIKEQRRDFKNEH